MKETLEIRSAEGSGRAIMREGICVHYLDGGNCEYGKGCRYNGRASKCVRLLECEPSKDTGTAFD